MSTKRLSKTVLEGGRHSSNKFDRYSSTSAERAKFRTYQRAVEKDPELSDDIAPPKRTPIGRGFTDKLAPVYRWLDSRVGKSWPKTLRLLKEKFDDRTLAGFHIVHQHILNTIGTEEQEKTTGSSRHYYYVDKHNILRKSEQGGYKNFKYLKSPADFDSEEIRLFLNKRKLAFVKGVLYWFEVIGDPEALMIHWNYRQEKFDYHWEYGSGKKWSDPIEFAQGARCTSEEVNYFRNLPEWIRKKLTQKKDLDALEEFAAK